MGRSSGDENANLYMRGVEEGYNDDFLDASELLDILNVFGEDGLRSYLLGILEGEEDAREEEAEADPDAVEVIVDYETGEMTPIQRDEDEDLEEDDSENGGHPDE